MSREEHNIQVACVRWLNHSFMPFSKKQEKLYKKFREYYDNLKISKNGNQR